MAITIIQEPQFFQPGCNPYVWTFSSDQTFQSNFSFIVELYVGGALVSTHQVFNESGDFGKFDASGDIRCLLTSEMITTGSLLTFYDSAVNTASIRVYEKFGSPPVLSSIYAQSSNSRAWNASLRHADFIDYDHFDYMVSRTNPNSGNILFLTDFPRDRKYFVGLFESAFVTFVNTSKPSVELFLQLYDITGATVATYQNTITVGDLNVIDCSPQNLITNTTLTLLDFMSCAYFTVQVQGLGVGIYSGFTERFTFWMDTECHRYETNRLHWLNKLGGWDSFTFTLVSTHSTKVKTSEYQRERGQWNSDGTNWIYNRYHGEQMAFNKSATDMTILNSDYIHESVQQWMARDLYESPKVYLERAVGQYEPVKVMNENYNLKQRRVDGLIREVVTLERTYTYNSQLT